MKPLTSKEYVAAGGTVCPYCRSENITGSSIEVDAGGASQEIYCSDCTHCWYDTYTLTGYEAIE